MKGKLTNSLKEFSFDCSVCQKMHTSFPELIFDFPIYWAQYEKEIVASTSHLSSDYCTINDSYYFVKGVLTLKDKVSSFEFSIGCWVSLSKKKYDLWKGREFDGDEFSGWFCTQIPTYPDCTKVKAKLIPQKNHYHLIQ